MIVQLFNSSNKTSVDLFPTFIITSLELLDTLVKGVLSFVHTVKCQRTVKPADELVHLCQHRHSALLLGIFLTCSLSNKLDELQLLVGKNRLLFISCVVLHGNLAVRIDIRLCAACGRFPSLQSRSPHGTLRQDERWRNLFLH